MRISAVPDRAQTFKSFDELIIPKGFIPDPDETSYFDPEENEIHCFVLQEEDLSQPVYCPQCGRICRLNGHKTRICQILPVAGMTTYVHIRSRRYVCPDQDCGCSAFRPSEGFKTFQHRSDELNLAVFVISAFCSDVSAALICNFLGIKISHDSIRRLLSHVKVEDDPDVEVIGVDDVCLKKGRSYYTVIYDEKDHHLMALLN